MGSAPRLPIDPCAEHCPARIRDALDLIGGKWSVPIIVALHETGGPVRYAELQRRLHPVTPKELAKHLRHLEAAGLVDRRVHPTVPPRVDYGLSELGLSLYPSLRSLGMWAAEFGALVARNRSAKTQRRRRLIGFAG